MQVRIDTEFIRLEALLKYSGLCATGGEAKHAIQMGFVRVNGNICTERGKKLHPGDVALYERQEIVVS